MHNATLEPLSFAALFDPTVARAAAERAASWKLPRRTCRPLDRYASGRVNPALFSYDNEIDCAAAPEDELPVELVSTCGFAEQPDSDDDL